MVYIHNSGEVSFRPNWVNYCKKNNIDFQLVNAYDNDIIEQLKDCSIFLFNFHHTKIEDFHFAKSLIFSIQQAGIKVFPDFNTGWHFDDKLAQKYLLESIGAPFVKTYAFYSKNDALNWANKTSFPKVFKLKGGAGSNNVSLIKSRKHSKKIISKAFSKGFSKYNRFNDFKEVLMKYFMGAGELMHVFKSFRRLFVSTKFANQSGNDAGYLLVQDFIPNNTFDIRVIVIGKKAFAIKRLVRKNDFRASGGGAIIYDKSEIDDRCVKISFDVNKKLKSQCVAYDFVFDEKNNPLIVEISYGFAKEGYIPCPGYWDEQLNWYVGNFDPCGWIIENLMKIK